MCEERQALDPPSGSGDGLPAFQMGKWNIFVLWNLIIDVAQVLIYLLGSYFRYIMIKWDCLDWLEILCVPGLVDSVTLCGPRDYSPPGSSVHGHSPGKNTGVGCHALFQGIFPTQVLTAWMTLSIFWEKAFEISNSWFITTHVHTLEAGEACTDIQWEHKCGKV